VHHDGHLARMQTVGGSGRAVEYLVNHLDLQEVVTGAQRAHLVEPASVGPLTDGGRIRTG
jgi:hypothetical protein